MSFYKCFYCESKLKGKVSEIDHYKEVSEYKEGAYEWENLFLSCENCNGKIPHQIIPVTEALNPFLDTDQEIKKHLTFEDEQITMKPDSILGSKTIQKFRLDSPSLDMLRLKQIKIFQQCCISVQKNMILEGRNKMSEKELESLRSFANPDKSFSLMFEILLEKMQINQQTK
ncbi:MAG: HNH endonuclease [Bacteroidetes bacterium]|nr:MAG: HNH endonuclease [Bacteroidota bacterium]